MPLINHLRDDFADNSIAPTWTATPTGSATVAETIGQARFTLPSSTAGSHDARYVSNALYDITADSCFVNIDTMVSTSVAATAFFALVADTLNYLIWTQTSGTLKAQTVVAGVTTDRYSVAWNATTYKYLRIRESGGNVLFDSSSNGTAWTNRASVAAPFAVTALSVRFGANCGNVASPGSFRIEEFNTILPALTTNWHYTQVEWPLLYRFRDVTIAATSGQGYVATSNDGTTWAYYSGPMGSASGGYNQLTAQSTQAAAQAMAVNLPTDGRWALPSMVECRFIRLYHRSTTGATYTLREYYPRRLVQSDDIEAESIRAINIAAGAITADKINVVSLSAIAAFMGALTMDGPIDITTGSITGGGGVVTLSADGLELEVGATYLDDQSYRLIKTGGTYMGGLGGYYATGSHHTVEVNATTITGEDSIVIINAEGASGASGTIYLQVRSGLTNYPAITATTDGTNNTITIDALNTNGEINLTSPTTITEGLNVGSATGAGAGDILAKEGASRNFQLEATDNATYSRTRLLAKTSGGTVSDWRVVNDSSGASSIFTIYGGDGASLATRFRISANGATGFFGGAGATQQTVTGSRGGNAALASLLTALANYGLIVNSSSA